MAAKKQPSTDAPSTVKLTSLYAFYDEDGALRSWNEGQIVTGDDVALLLARSAPVVEVE